MIILELLMALLAPAVELAIPLFIGLAEILFWLALFVVEVFVALFYRRKVKVPSKPRFLSARSRLKSFARKVREKRATKNSS